jgi:hypothetical protein
LDVSTAWRVNAFPDFAFRLDFMFAMQLSSCVTDPLHKYQLIP